MRHDSTCCAVNVCGWDGGSFVVCTATLDGWLRVWAAETGKCVWASKVHEKKVNDIVMIGEMLLTCSEDSTAKLFCA